MPPIILASLGGSQGFAGGVREEDPMRVLESVRAAWSKLGLPLGRQPDQLSCGECERWERCGLPPSDQCITRAAQIARRDEEPDRPPRWWGSLGAG